MTACCIAYYALLVWHTTKYAPLTQACPVHSQLSFTQAVFWSRGGGIGAADAADTTRAAATCAGTTT